MLSARLNRPTAQRLDRDLVKLSVSSAGDNDYPNDFAAVATLNQWLPVVAPGQRVGCSDWLGLCGLRPEEAYPLWHGKVSRIFNRTRVEVSASFVRRNRVEWRSEAKAVHANNRIRMPFGASGYDKDIGERPATADPQVVNTVDLPW